MSTKKFSDLPATSSCTLGSSPVMVICDRWAGWSGPLQSSRTIVRAGLDAFLFQSLSLSIMLWLSLPLWLPALLGFSAHILCALASHLWLSFSLFINFL